MASSIAGDPLVFSPRSADQIRKRLLSLLIIGISVAVLLVLLRVDFYAMTDRNRGSVARAWELGFLPGLVLMTGLMLLAMDRGTWLIDDQGITSWRAFRRNERLTWPEVERVLWTSKCATLEGAGRRITIGCGSQIPSLSRREWRIARTRLETVLSPHFDLKMPPWPVSFNRVFLQKSSRPWPVLILVAYVSIPFMPGILATNRGSLPILVLGWITVPFVGFVGSVVMDGVRYHRVQRRTHPQYPWRLRLPADHSASPAMPG